MTLRISLSLEAKTRWITAWSPACQMVCSKKMRSIMTHSSGNATSQPRIA